MEERPKAVTVRAVPNTVRVSDVRACDCSNAADEVAYEDVINFSRSSIRSHHHCVMCGALKDEECVIPNQNKDVCKVCDSSFWYQKRLKVVVKFCKGCKKFCTLSTFTDKPDAAKCGKCRERGRLNYYSRKVVEETPNSTCGAKPKSVTFADNIQTFNELSGHKRSMDDMSLQKLSPNTVACSPAMTPSVAKRSRSCSDGDTSTIDRICDQFDWDPNANSLMNLAMLSGQVLELEMQQSSSADTTPRGYDPIVTFRKDLKFSFPYTFADLKLSNSGMPLTLSPIAVTTFDANYS